MAPWPLIDHQRCVIHFALLLLALAPSPRCQFQADAPRAVIQLERPNSLQASAETKKLTLENQGLKVPAVRVGPHPRLPIGDCPFRGLFGARPQSRKRNNESRLLNY